MKRHGAQLLQRFEDGTFALFSPDFCQHRVVSLQLDRRKCHGLDMRNRLGQIGQLVLFQATHQ